jgi:hypothetical protein
VEKKRFSPWQVFTSEKLRAHVRNAGIQVIGYRELRNLIRAETGT